MTDLTSDSSLHLQPSISCQPESDSSSSSTRAASRKNRVYVFREFLLKTYGDYLLQNNNNNNNDNSIVLDVAGGKGDLSFLLQNVDDIQSIVMDPRGDVNPNLQKHHIIKSIRYLREHPEETQKRSIPGLPTYQPLAALLPKLQHKKEKQQEHEESNNDDESNFFVSPQQIRIFLNAEFVDSVRKVVEQYRNLLKNNSKEVTISDALNACPEWERHWNSQVENNKQGSSNWITK